MKVVASKGPIRDFTKKVFLEFKVGEDWEILPELLHFQRC